MKRFGLFLTAAIAVMGLMFVTACKSEPDTPPPPPVKFTVTFDKNTTDEVTGVPADQTITKGGKVTAPTTDPVRVGYDLDGWYKEATTTTAWDFGVDTVTADTTLYAKWSFDDENYWLVTFKVKDGATLLTQAVSKELAYVTDPGTPASLDIIADPSGIKGVWGWYPDTWDGEDLEDPQFDFATTEIEDDTVILAGLETLFVHGTPVTTQDKFGSDVITITNPPVEGMEGGVYNRFTGGVYLSDGGHQLGYKFIEGAIQNFDNLEVTWSFVPGDDWTPTTTWTKGDGVQIIIKLYDTHDDVSANAVPDQYPWFDKHLPPAVYNLKSFGFYEGFAWEWNPDNDGTEATSGVKAHFTLFLDKVVYSVSPDIPPYVVIGDDAGEDTAMSESWMTESESGSGIYYVDTGVVGAWSVQEFPLILPSDFDITNYTKVTIITDMYLQDGTIQVFNADSYSDAGVGLTTRADIEDGLRASTYGNGYTNPSDETFGSVIRILSQASVTSALPGGLSDAPNFAWVKAGTNGDNATRRIVVKKLVFHN